MDEAVNMVVHFRETCEKGQAERKQASRKVETISEDDQGEMEAEATRAAQVNNAVLKPQPKGQSNQDQQIQELKSYIT